MIRASHFLANRRANWSSVPTLVQLNHTLTNLPLLLYFLNKWLTIGGLFPWYHQSMGKIMLSLPAILSFMQCRPAWAGVTEQTDNGYRLEGTHE